MKALLERPPGELSAALTAAGGRRAWLLVEGSGPNARVRASSPPLQALADALPDATPALDDHAGVFLQACARTGALFGAFIHRARRGQAQGGLRNQPYDSLRQFLHDGLRLSRGMSRKSALAGLWWGGGKGIIARAPGDGWHDPAERRLLYERYGRFVSSLRGCYVTAVDSGTTPADMTHIHTGTRFATCVSPETGGSGDPSAMTAAGVISAIEAALDHAGRGGITGKRFAMQGGGNVGSHMIRMLVDRGAARIIVAEIDDEQRAWLADRFGGAPVDLRRVGEGDASILAEPCDVLIPNGLGGVLDDKTIPGIRSGIVCGAANNQLAEEQRDARALHARGIVWVPDYLANRMGIVSCADEHAGHLADDDAIARHLDPVWDGSVYATTRRVLACAERNATTPLDVTDRLADDAVDQLHPIRGDRAEQIVRSLISTRWDRAAAPGEIA